MKIRVWKLGSLKHKILPTEHAMDRLEKILKDIENSSAESADIIWGPDLKVKLIEISDQDINVVIPDFKFSKEDVDKIKEFIKERVNDV